jgi:hypothetical protein
MGVGKHEAEQPLSSHGKAWEKGIHFWPSAFADHKPEASCRLHWQSTDNSNNNIQLFLDLIGRPRPPVPGQEKKLARNWYLYRTELLLATKSRDPLDVEIC